MLHYISPFQVIQQINEVLYKLLHHIYTTYTQASMSHFLSLSFQVCWMNQTPMKAPNG